MKNELKFIADNFGIENQVPKAIEELSELIRALCREDYNNIVEEIADVEIMLYQLKYLIGISKEEIKEIKFDKIQKTLGFIEV